MRDEIEKALVSAHTALEAGDLDTAEHYLTQIDLDSMANNYLKERISYFNAYKRLYRARNQMEQALEAGDAHTEAILAFHNMEKDILHQKMDVILSVFDYDLRKIIAAPTLIVGSMKMKISSLHQEIEHKDTAYLVEEINEIDDFMDEIYNLINLMSKQRDFWKK